MSESQTATVDLTTLAPTAVLALPLVLVADPNGSSRTRRAGQLQARGFRVALARTSFETIVKAACLLPDVILMDAAFADDAGGETPELLATCPSTSHIPIVRLLAGRRVPLRMLARARC